MKHASAPIPFAGSELGEMRHACAFFNNDEEEYRVLLPFITDGLERGEKAVHIVNPARLSEHVRQLHTAGVDVHSAQQRGQLELRNTIDTYLSDGKFDQHRMLDSFERLARNNRAAGNSPSRIVCQMDWASEGGPAVHDVVEFESRVNEVWSRYDDVVICVYPLARFGGETVIDIIRTHPVVVIGGILQHNPFFVPPRQFLQEFRERHDRAGFSSNDQ